MWTRIDLWAWVANWSCEQNLFGDTNCEQKLWIEIVNKSFKQELGTKAVIKIMSKSCEQKLLTKVINKIVNTSCQQKLWVIIEVGQMSPGHMLPGQTHLQQQFWTVKSEWVTKEVWGFKDL